MSKPSTPSSSTPAGGSESNLLPISAAAKLLGVSIYTLRRYEKQGLLTAHRSARGHRLFKVDELKQFLTGRPLSISEAAEQLDISVSTLRRLEKQGLIAPARDEHGNRLYTAEVLDLYRARRADTATTVATFLPAAPVAAPVPASTPERLERTTFVSQKLGEQTIANDYANLAHTSRVVTHAAEAGLSIPVEHTSASRGPARPADSTALLSIPLLVAAASSSQAAEPDDLLARLRTLPTFDRRGGASAGDSGQPPPVLPPGKVILPPPSSRKPQFQRSSAFIGAVAALVLLVALIVRGGSTYRGYLAEKNPLPDEIVMSLTPHNLVQAERTAVLGISREEAEQYMEVNLPTFFSKDVTVDGDLTVGGELIAPRARITELLVIEGANVEAEGVDLNLGSGTITASNIVNSIQGAAGDVLLASGNGISISGLTIANADRGSAQQIFKNVKVGTDTASADANSDTFTVAAGDNIELTLNKATDTLTIAAAGTTYEAGDDLDLDGTTFQLEDTLDTVTTLNGLTTIDGTTESTFEAALDASGDVSGTLAALTIGDDKVLERHFKAVDTAADEECLSYESTTGDFEWQTCSSGGGFTSFTLAGDAGSSQTITDGNTLTVATDSNLTATAGATDTVTISVDADAIDGVELADAITLDAATLTFTDGSNTLLTITDAGTTGNLTASGDLTISGDDLFMGTNTDGFILVADGTNYNPVAVSGDVTITNAGVISIGDDKVTEADLKAVNSSTDEYCLTKEDTTGDFEWQACGASSSNTLQQVYANDADGSDATIALTSADDSVVINNPSSSGTDSAFTFKVDQDATGVIGLAVEHAGTTADGVDIVASALTSGIALDVSNTSTAASSADLIQGDHTATYTASTTVSGQLLDLSRALTVNNAGQTLTMSGAVASISDNCTQTAGTCTSTADVLLITQDYASNSGAALNIDYGGGASGFGLRVNDDGTATDSTPFVVDATGSLGIGTASPGAKLDVNGIVTFNPDSAGSAAHYFTETSGNAVYLLRDVNGNNDIQLSTDSGGVTYFHSGGNVGIGTVSPEALLEIQGTEGADAVLALDADDGDEDADTWFIKSLASGNSLSFLNHTTEVAALSSAGNLQIDGDLTISGDDLVMGTNTSGFILVADGTNFNPVAMSGDITIDSTGATAIGNDKVTEADLKAVDAAADEECFTYESTTGDFEWQACGASSSNTLQQVYDNDADGSNATIALTTADDSIVINNPSSSGTDSGFALQIDQDAAGVIVLAIDAENTTADIIDISAAPLTTAIAIDIPDLDALTSGKGLNVVSGSEAVSSGELLTLALTSSGSANTAKTGALASIAASRTDTRTSGTTADDYDLFGLTRTSVQNGAGGTTTAAGSVLRIENVATQTAGTLTDTVKGIELVMDVDGSGDAIFIDANGTDTTSQIALNIDSESTTADVIAIDGTLLTTGDALQITLDSDAATTGQAIRVFSGTSANTQIFAVDEDGDTTMAGDLTISGDDLFMGTNTSGFILVADGTNFNPVAMSGDITISSAGATAIGDDKVTEADLKAVNSSTDEYCLTKEDTTGDFEWQACGASSSNTLQQVYDNDADGSNATIALTSADDSVVINNPSSSGTDSAFAFQIDQDATAVIALSIDAESTTADIVDISAAPLTTGIAIDISDADALTTGKGLNIASGSEAISSGQLLNLALTSSGSTNAAKTGALASIAASRTDTRTTGTTADDYDLLGLTRTSVQNGAGGTTTAAGAVLRIENVATQTAGTLTDTVKGIELVMDADGTGDALFIDSNASGAIALNVDSEATTVNVVDISPAVLTTGTALEIIDADALTTGKIMELASNSSSNGTRTLVNIVNDNTSATGTTIMQIRQDAAQRGLFLNQDGNGIALEIDSESTTADIMAIDGTQLTTGDALQITLDSDAATTGQAIRVFSGTAANTEIFAVDEDGDTTMAGDLTISGDDLFMGTNTSGFILVADGTNFNPVAVSGDATLSSAGALTIDADEIDFDQIEDTMDLDANLAINSTASGFDVVFNEDGNDSDFRIESDTNANLVFLDASTNQAAFGTATPVTLSTVKFSSSVFTAPLVDTRSAATASRAEIMAAFGTTDSDNALLIGNATVTDSLFSSSITHRNVGTVPTTRLDIFSEISEVEADAGGDSLFNFGALRRDSAQNFAAIATRPILTISNLATVLFQVDANGDIGIGSTDPEALLEIQGIEATDAVLALDADDGDDAADTWFIKSLASGNSLSFMNHTTEVAALSSVGNLQIDGDLTISGDDLVMGTNTSGFILVADGTNFNPVAVSGDVNLSSAGAVTIGADKVLESHLKAVDTASDEECLTYESTVGDFEWQSCGSGASNLQGAYDGDADGSNAIISLTSADDAVVIQNDNGTNDSAFSVLIDQNDTAGVDALTIDSESTDSNAILITHAGDGTDNAAAAAISITAESGAGGLYVARNLGAGDDDPLVEIVSDHASGDQPALFIDNDATAGLAFSIDAENTTADIIDISAAPLTTAIAIDIPDLDVVTSGKGLNVASGSEAITSGELLTLALTSSGSSIANKTGALGSVAASRTETRTSGATSDDYDLFSLTRTSIVNGSGGGYTAAGSVLRIENVATPTAGTLSDTAIGIELVMDADGIGDSLWIDSNQSATANSVDIDHAAAGSDVIDILSEHGTYTADVIQLSANEEDTGTFNFLKLISDADGTPDTELTINQDGDILTDGGITAVGVVDFGGATSSEIVNGSSPTVDAAGEIAVDTTGDQLIYFGAAKRVLAYQQKFSATLESPSDADNFNLLKVPYAVTVTDIHCIVDPADSGESVVIDVQERDGTADNPASVDATITCDNDGAEDDGSLSNGPIDANDWISLDIGTVTGTVTQVTVTVTYTIDAT